MVPNKDYYVDKDDKLTTDPSKYAAQVAVAGVELEERVASRYGITDALVSVDEPGAVRKVRGAKPERDKETEPEPEAKSETEAAADETDESTASVKVKKAEASKPVATKGAEKK